MKSQSSGSQPIIDLELIGPSSPAFEPKNSYSPVSSLNNSKTLVDPSEVAPLQKDESAKTQFTLDSTYREMRRLASRYMTKEQQTVSMSPTVLVHEAYVRLAAQSSCEYQSQSHFLAVAATMMRRILVDHARARKRIKRGGNYVRVKYDEEFALSTSRDADVLALEEALEELGKLDERQAKIVEMRFYGGMTVPEVAEVIGLSTRTVENEWKLCRAWLRTRLDDSQS